MIKIRYETDAPILRIGSRKTFRISSPKAEKMRDRRKIDLELEAGEVYGAIYQPPPSGSPPGEMPPQDDDTLTSRISVNEEQ